MGNSGLGAWLDEDRESGLLKETAHVHGFGGPVRHDSIADRTRPTPQAVGAAGAARTHSAESYLVGGQTESSEFTSRSYSTRRMNGLILANSLQWRALADVQRSGTKEIQPREAIRTKW